MATILSIESSTEICSVAISRDGDVVAIRENNLGRDHARSVAIFTDEVLSECGIAASELDCVAVSMGPGSYTGLRIGVSFAKGLCYGLNIPLVAVGSLEALSQIALASGEIGEGDVMRAMVDARRMEVYTQLFDSEAKSLGDVEAVVVDEASFEAERAEGRLVIFGDGASKCLEVLSGVRLVEVEPSARGVAKVAEAKLERGEVEDVAYFEPFYLKEVVITKSKKKLF